MGEFSLTHWLVIIILLLLFFGPSKLPQLGRSLGEAIRDFKKGISEIDEPNSQKNDLTAQKQIADKSKDTHS